MAAAPHVRRAGDDVARLDDLLDLLGSLERRQRDAVGERGRLRDVGAPDGAPRRAPEAARVGFGPTSSSPGSVVTDVPVSPATGSTTLGRSFGSGGSSRGLLDDPRLRRRGRGLLARRAERERPGADRREDRDQDDGEPDQRAAQKLVRPFAPAFVMPMWMWSRCALVLSTRLRGLPFSLKQTL